MRRLQTLARTRKDAEVHQVVPGVSVRVFHPPVAPTSEPGPALLWIHGGGYVIGSAAQDDSLCQRFADELGVLVASVDYRLAPEFPYPTPVEDCYGALQWLADRAEVNHTQIAIGGASAGGGLAASIAILARDRAVITPIFQLLAYPMLDDRTDTVSTEHRLWDAKSNRFAWDSYLGSTPAEVAAPAHAKDLSELPSAWIGVGTLDLFHDEDLTYAARLEQAGVPCTVTEVPGAFHGFDLVAARAAVSREFFDTQCGVLRAAFQRA
ncbi:MAG: alpha/beta hydrolase [Gordonia sp.]|nr:alpha/beta hydrolase [Gordonia sp. (in: high G+C Gram-positive bacteria)]